VAQERKVSIEEFFFTIPRNRVKREGYAWTVLERVTDEMTWSKEKDVRRKRN
jgi:anti-sigma regulatory factor (Ser/Thr protein kinase)